MSDNFLSRWSKRKLEAKEQEKQLENLSEPIQGGSELSIKQAPAELNRDSSDDSAVAVSKEPQVDIPLPTEADLTKVEQGGDIKAFMVDKVSAELKNKAFKALFSRPEFNVMDGLDIYIDDYSKFTPLSQEDIGKMTLSKQLLSRPDLELPKIGDIKEGLNALPGSVDELPEVPTPVLDKQENEAQTGEENTQTEGDPRVIPNESQAIDSQEQLTERSFENLPKK
ncbi:conserved hypothetical protein [Limnobacter sp. 130]|uniref:DUF3306 domain-containing protein n=1 Tax=Limnobacter sp. 130 TaxID=2653147 RepID=UPI0012F2DC56|nr:DUF3306 domain-containing protein [Limnobacter sp. 130]VWX35980.1 conserved hypothetical protein [Limnobacter sp. 130]